MFGRRLLLIRYGEIALKGLNRPFFLRSLEKNILKAIKERDDDNAVNGDDSNNESAGLSPKIARKSGRIFLYKDNEEVLKEVLKVPGVVSVSPAIQLEKDLNAVIEQAVRFLFAAKKRGIKSFKINTNRADKSFLPESMEVNAKVGKKVQDEIPGLSVDLDNPDYTFYIEIRKEGIYIYSQIYEGPGGLPAGTSGTGLLLLSGGIDSPVAGWLSCKRGMAVNALYFHSPPFTGDRVLQKVEDLSRVLKDYSPELDLSVVSITHILKELKVKIPEKFILTIMRRFMVRIAEKVAIDRNIPVLITGECIGQVATQTLENMAVIERAVNIPILRPLASFDKTEITKIARSIGTYDISIRPHEDCCTLFVPKHPVLKPQLEVIENIESNLNINDMVDEAASGRETNSLET